MRRKQDGTPGGARQAAQQTHDLDASREVEELEDALDRVLQWGHYVVPNWHIRSFRGAFWNRFSRPAVTPKYDLGFESWWVDPTKDQALGKRGS